MERAEIVSDKIKILKATQNEKPIIERLIQLYMYDMSENYPDWPIRPDGLWEYNLLDKFWQHPYLLYVDNNLVGFALVINRNPHADENIWFMAEFFILKNQRGKGDTPKLLNEILKQHSGNWCISVLKNNQRAKKFWEKCLPNSSEISNENYDEEEWQSFRFKVIDES